MKQLIIAIILLNILSATEYISDNKIELSNNTTIKLEDIKEGTLTRKIDDDCYEILPHIDTAVEISIEGMVSNTTINQVFTNNTGEPIEAVYIFPLPINSAIYDMKMLVNNRLIQGVIKEREEAKKIYTEAKAAGKRTALTEQERPNIFTNSVANIMPNDTIIVQLQYVEKLKYENGAFLLRFPMVVAPRYIPGNTVVGYSGTGWAFDSDVVQDASRVTPQVIPPGYRNGNNISISIDLNGGIPTDSISSMSHNIIVNHKGENHYQISLKDKKAISNRDFILTYMLKSGSQPKAALFSSKKNNDDYFMLMAMPPIKNGFEEKLHKEMILVIDVSGSMAGTSIRQAKRGIKHALSVLNANDYFNIIQFQSTYKLFKPQPIIATEENIAKAMKYIDGLVADGGTEAKLALLAAMKQVRHAEAVSTILFLTDGNVGNEDDIIRAVNGNLGTARLFCVGIGSVPNSHLLNKVSKFGRVTFTYISSLSEVESQMMNLFNKIEQPVLTDLHLKGVDNIELFPNPIPDLFAGQPMVVFGKLNQLNVNSVTLEGKSPAGIINMKLPLDLASAPKEPAIPTLWAREEISGLMDDYRLGNIDIKQNIIELAVEHHLLTKFTSFVAVENKIVNPNGKANLQSIPVALPDGWVYDKVFSAKQKSMTISKESNGTLPQTGTVYPLLFVIGLISMMLSIMLLWKFQFGQK